MQDSARKFKEEVAEAAISLFKRNGYNNVTVNEICKECGISRSVFYSSFNGKRSILEYMVEKPQHNDDASFMKFAHADNDFERIWQLFDRFITIAYDFGPAQVVLMCQVKHKIFGALHRCFLLDFCATFMRVPRLPLAHSKYGNPSHTPQRHRRYHRGR